jgi:hypothetical protein
MLLVVVQVVVLVAAVMVRNLLLLLVLLQVVEVVLHILPLLLLLVVVMPLLLLLTMLAQPLLPPLTPQTSIPQPLSPAMAPRPGPVIVRGVLQRPKPQLRGLSKAACPACSTGPVFLPPTSSLVCEAPQRLVRHPLLEKWGVQANWPARVDQGDAEQSGGWFQ